MLRVGPVDRTLQNPVAVAAAAVFVFVPTARQKMVSQVELQNTSNAK